MWKEAKEWARTGGQALFIPGFVCGSLSPTPRVFKGKRYGYLLDTDRARLVATAKKLGVNVIKVDRLGVEGQHINLCGRPLLRAEQEAGKLNGK